MSFKLVVISDDSERVRRSCCQVWPSRVVIAILASVWYVIVLMSRDLRFFVATSSHDMNV